MINKIKYSLNQHLLVFVITMFLFTILVTFLSEPYGINLISTSFVKVLGKTLCLCIAAVAMDVVWGYCGILSLGHFAFFGLGGYMIGMWLMYERTEIIVLNSINEKQLPFTDFELKEAIGNQIFGVVGGREIPAIWLFADNLYMQINEAKIVLNQNFFSPSSCLLLVQSKKRLWLVRILQSYRQNNDSEDKVLK